MDISQKILSDITVFNKYAKFIPELSRRETWGELCDRNMSMHIKKFPQLEEEILEIYKNYVVPKKVLPSMRALENNTPIITKDGWKLCGDIKVGDVLYSSKGKETIVKDIIKFDDVELFKLKFSDKSELVACKDHLWIISTNDDLNEKNKTRVVNTLFLKDHLKQGDKHNITIWNTLPIERDEKILGIDPYILGLWLGDGYSNGTQYSCSVEDSEFIMNKFKEKGYSYKQSISSNIWTWNISGLKNDLLKYNLIQNKHIPKDFIYSSINQRLELLSGLMDSDGHIEKSGRCSFSNTNIDIIEPLKEILSSLGIKYIETISKKEKEHHLQLRVISFFTDLCIAKLPRKLGNIRLFKSSRTSSRKIFKIESIGKGNATCFHVDSEDHSFLAGEKMIVTHNSMQFAGLPIEISNSRIFNCAYTPIDHPFAFAEIMFLLLGGTGVGYSVQKRHIEKLPIIQGPSNKTRRFLIDDSISGWADSIKVLVKAYTKGKSNPLFDFRDIRPKGSRLVTSGGKAPGPAPLKICLEQVRNILDGAIGRKLYTLEVHDICCHIADAVLSGGIRRAAMICGFDIDDMDMLTCKTGTWYELNPQRGRANNTVILKRGTVKEEDFKKLWEIVKNSGSGEPGFFWTSDYDIFTNPCGEISLNPHQVCNLSEVNVSDIETQEDLNNRVSAAAFIGTLQATYTDFHYLRPQWKDATEKEALIGVGMTGIGSGKIQKFNLEEAAECVKETNEKYAKILGINVAARTTTIKPSGTSSCVVGSSSGIHAWHNDYYIRRMRIGKGGALYNYLKENMPELVEDCVFKPHLEAVISIPQKAPEGSILRSESALELLERVKKFNLEWVKAGYRAGKNQHNVSCTISIKDYEWESVGNWMWENRRNYTGIAVLPYDGGSYIQAPFEDCTEEVYDKMMTYLKDINLLNVEEVEDNTSLKEQVACAGGACEVSF